MPASGPSHAPPMPAVASGGPRPVFPAYHQQQQPPASSEPGRGNAAGGMAPTLPEVVRKPAEKVPPVGAGCKLMHPEDDLSLVCE